MRNMWSIHGIPGQKVDGTSNKGSMGKPKMKERGSLSREVEANPTQHHPKDPDELVEVGGNRRGSRFEAENPMFQPKSK